MKNIDSIFNFYVKNKINSKIEEESTIVFASLIALVDYNRQKDFDLQTVIKMIILGNTNPDNLTNKNEVNNILNVLHNVETKESLEAQKCLEKSKKMQSSGIEEDIDKIYGRLLLATGIDIENNLQLEFSKLYEIILKMTNYDIEKEKNNRIKYYYYNTHDVTREYAHLISLLEEIIDIKIKEIKNSEEKDFHEKYETEKQFYRSVPILSGVLEKIKKL